MSGGGADVVDQSWVEAKEGLALASTSDKAGLAGDGVGLIPSTE